MEAVYTPETRWSTLRQALLRQHRMLQQDLADARAATYGSQDRTRLPQCEARLEVIEHVLSQMGVLER